MSTRDIVELSVLGMIMFIVMASLLGVCSR